MTLFKDRQCEQSIQAVIIKEIMHSYLYISMKLDFVIKSGWSLFKKICAMYIQCHVVCTYVDHIANPNDFKINTIMYWEPYIFLK